MAIPKRITTPEELRRYWKSQNLRRNYGIGLDEAEVMLAAQGGVCAVCLRPVSFGAAKNTHNDAVVDHSHATGVVRGIIHGSCNQALGHLKEDPEIFELAAAYLRRHA